MTKVFRFFSSFVLAAASMGLFMNGVAQAQDPSPAASVVDGDSIMHLFPTANAAKPVSQFATGPLLYHGGPVMQGGHALYGIFWLPASRKLQSGAATAMPSHYQFVMHTLLTDYPGHSQGRSQHNREGCAGRGAQGAGQQAPLATPASGCGAN